MYTKIDRIHETLCSIHSCVYVYTRLFIYKALLVILISINNSYNY